MWEIMLLAFVRLEHASSVRDPEIRTYRNGLFGMIGNKGGIQLNFTFRNYNFNFVTCHLRHGQNAVELRNAMMSDLVKQTKSRDGQRQFFDTDVLADFAFILGDLNYRLDTGFSEFVDKVQTAPQKFAELDQLFKTMRSEDNPSYPGFDEPPVTFLPTYKRDRNDNFYVNKKNQAPSYTDRILLRNNTTYETEVHKYDVLDNVFGSDHRPVVLDCSINLGLQSLLNEV